MLYFATIFSAASVGTISQNRLYSDNMILESRESYDVRPFIAGFGTTPGESVVVTFGGTHTMSYPTTVGADGKWEVQMNSCNVALNQTLTVKGEENTLTYTNVACGQVYVCGGQSNMELTLDYVDGGAALAAKIGNNPKWRLFRVPHTASSTPQDGMFQSACTPVIRLSPDSSSHQTLSLSLTLSLSSYH